MRILLVALVIGSSLLHALRADEGGTLSVKDFTQTEVKTGADVDALESGSGQKDHFVVKEGSPAFGSLLKTQPQRVKDGDVWEIAMDFEKGEAATGESYLTLGVTPEISGALAGTGGDQQVPAFFVRIKAHNEEFGWFDYGNITDKAHYDVSAPFRFEKDDHGWYRFRLKVTVSNAKAGSLFYEATLSALAPEGAQEVKPIGKFSGELTNAELFETGKLYAGFRVDSSGAVRVLKGFRFVRAN